MIYLDYAATTPMSAEALEVYISAAKTYFANTMSLHDLGGMANELLAYCRSDVARNLNGNPDGIVFTSGGSESNLIAIYGLAMAYRKKGMHILVGGGVHNSVKSALGLLNSQGFEVEELEVDVTGRTTMDALARHIKRETILVILNHVNPELGIIEDLETLGPFLAERGILCHVDAVQSFGKLPLNVGEARISSVAFSSHKIYGPKGVGGCYIDPVHRVEPALPFIAHERGLRQGTVNIPGIAAFTEAMNQAYSNRSGHYSHVADLKAYMVEELQKKQVNGIVEGEFIHTSPYILALRMPGYEGQLVMLEANRRGIAIATGSACSIHKQRPSEVLTAMGRSRTEAHELIRISFGRETTKAEIDRAIEVLKEISEGRNGGLSPNALKW